VDGFCREHGLAYHLAYGTLLGALRHGGYVPWDDDLDLMMPRADLDRFLAGFPGGRTGAGHLSVRHPGSEPGWPLPFAKVSDDRTELVEPMDLPLRVGVNVDVFPVDALPASRLRRRLQLVLLRGLGWALEIRYVDRERGRLWHHPRAITWGKALLRPVPVALLVRALTETARRPGRGSSGRVAVRGPVDWSVPAAALGAGRDVVFEGVTCRAPADPDAVLRAVYGDWRTLPPAHLQVSHHSFTARWRRPLS
jgi:lipopolysaccharide cholinephosphotransferase